jgi:hypothetical protein
MILSVLTSVSYILLKRTPEKILLNQLEFDLTDFNYDIIYSKEEWSPNGDGYYLAQIKFNEITKENIDYIKSQKFHKLPIDVILSPNDIPPKWENKKEGYFKLKYFDKDVRNFKILFLDIDKKELLIYYQLE